MSTWQTVWQIAGMRNNTKRGEGHLSGHGFEVLQAFVQDEAREAMAKSVVGNVHYFDLETGDFR